jgi:autotransporter-associated beta strand protein
MQSTYSVTANVSLRLWTRLLAFSLLSVTVLSVDNVMAGSATWALEPASDDWFTAANWVPKTVPDETSDIATFGVSNVTNIMMDPSTFAYISGITFSPGASAYTFTGDFSFPGEGVINNSGVIQSFDAVPSVGFSGNATAGEHVIYVLHATEFNARAAFFADNANAGNGTFFVHGQRPGDTWGAGVSFLNNSSAANSTIINYGPEGGLEGAETTFDNFSSAGNSKITLYTGAWMDFTDNATAANSVLTIDGGEVDFEGKTDGAEAQIILTNGGLLVVSGHSGRVFSIGSLAGDGVVELRNQQTSIGSNGQSTTFSGVIEEGGGANAAMISKIGTGTLALSGLNTYSGGTTVEAGTLLVNNPKGSATGEGTLQVNSGTFGGRSNISGAVTIGSGSGTGAYLAPGIKGPGVLAIHNNLTFKADGTYNCDLSLTQGKADKVIAKGVTIENGAQFALQAKGNQTLPAGTVFTVIENKSRQHISGVFANLPDNSTITANDNTFQVSYEGGDGNDLTLTLQ